MSSPPRLWRVLVGGMPAVVLAVVAGPSWLLVGALLGPVLLSWVDLVRDALRRPVEVVPRSARPEPSGARGPGRPLRPAGGLTMTGHR